MTVANAAIEEVYTSSSNRLRNHPLALDFALTPSGFSSVPANAVYRYWITGRFVHFLIRQPTAGTSNSTSFTIPAPFTSANITNAFWFASAIDATNNGVDLTTAGRFQLGANSATITVASNAAGAGWTAANGKRASGLLIYEI
jgi:hypothetical protein